MNREIMTDDQISKVGELIRGSYSDIVKIKDFNSLINENIIDSVDDTQQVEDNVKISLSRICNPRCLRSISSSGSDEDFVCRKINNFKSSPDNTRSCVIHLGNKLALHNVEILRKIKLF